MVGMDTGTVLPAGLADLPPGPALAAALSTVDRSRLSGAQLAVVLRAQYRQVAHEQARLLADAVELAKVPWDGPGKVTREQADEYASIQVGLTMTISPRYADHLLDLGQVLLERLPMVYAALSAGRIDYPKAMAFSQCLALLDDDTARRIATDTLARAEGWTSTELRDRLRYRAQRADPDLARRRYRASVADRRVAIDLDCDGTAQLNGINLPVDRAAAAEDRLNRLARAAKAGGDIRTIGQLRADAMLDLLTGITFRLHPSSDPYTTDADTEAADTGAADTRAAGTRAADTRAAGTRAADTRAAGTGEADTGAGEIAANADQRARVGADRPADVCACGGVRPAQRRGVVDVMVKLSTLMGLDDDLGWLPGWGPVLADIARQIAFDQQANPAWKWSATNDSGQLRHHGHTRRRPVADEAAFVKARDRTCRFPGCRRPAMRCDIDHRLEHTNGGPSHRGNACCECPRHHQFRHAKGFTVEPFGSSGFLWTAPDGRLYLVPEDGNLVAVEASQDDDGCFDLDNARPPREVRQIIPV
jgi:hypothetical protein